MGRQRRIDPDLQRRIKEMEDAARRETLANAEVSFVQPEGEDQTKLSYDQWWMLTQPKIKVRPHLKEIIWADMKARGLTKSETHAKYDEALRLFGYKV